MIIDQMALGAVAVGQFWARQADFEYNANKFWAFKGEPTWLTYPTPAPQATPPAAQPPKKPDEK